MTELFQTVVLRAGVFLLVALAVVSILVGLFYAGRYVARRLGTLTLVVMSFVAIVTTVLAQKGDRGTGTTGVPPVGEQQTGTIGVPSVGDELTNTLHFSSIDIYTNGTATLTVTWPADLFPTDTTIDILSATSLVNSAWTWQCNHMVAAGETNWIVTVALPENAPGMNVLSAFYRALHRESCADTMADLDGDGLPNVYELAHGRNPWVNDYALVQKLTVGPNGEFGDIFSALAASEAYSVIVLTSGVHQVNHDVQMPNHPVMVTCEDGYAVLSGASQRAMFLLGSGHESGHTLFRNLYLNLASTGGMQAGFWCGGELPWKLPGAAAVFESVHIRAPNPGVEYFGWLFYGHCEAPAVIRGCCVNASGAEWIYAIFGDNPPPIVVESCTFVNFPTQSVYQSTAIGLRSTHANGTITSTPPVALSRVMFDASFTKAWPMARFENASGFPVTMTDCIRPSEPTSPDFMPSVTGNVHIVTSQVAWAGFPLADSPAAMLGIGAFAPIPSDSLDDTDHDTLLDYNEVYDRGLDPFLADTDGDGVSDNQEISDGTDPADPHSFKQNLTVTVTNTASAARAVYTAWGVSDAGWEANGLASFPEGFGTTNYVDASSQGATHIMAFCDLNGNGTFEVDHDILLVREIPPSSTALVTFIFGDVDGDGASDAQEHVDGTNPYDANNFRLRAKLKFTDHDAGYGCTNFVAVSLTETEWDLSEVVMISAGSTFDYTVNTNVTHGVVYVKCLHDRDGDGLLDVGSEGITTNLLFRSRDLGNPIEVSIGDCDYDGVCDTQEMLEGTDPFDWRNYLMRTRIDVAVSDDGCGVTNLVSVSEAYDDWQQSSVVTSFVGYAATYATNGVLTTGALQVRCIRDFDRDGEFGTPGDIVYRASAGHTWNGKRFHLAVGDCDGDGIPDSVEKAEGTDPTGATNYCFSLSATVTSIFTPTNRLTAIAYFGDESNILYGPSVQTGSTLSVDFGHLTTSSREKVKFLFWDDIDGNGVRDAGERRTVCEFPVTGHDMCVTNSLGLGEFDADSDGMLDDWERQHGLSPTNAADATLDADGDSHINLHEYWEGTAPDDPLDYESGTALVAGSRSVDDRIAGKQTGAAKPYYNGFDSGAYPTNTPLTNIVFTLNTDCWLYGVDLSCMSIWSDQPENWSTEPLTLISPLHMMCASHVTPANGTRVVFRSFAGDLFVRTLVDTKPLQGVADNDLCIGILDEPLPSDIKVARFLPPGYSRYIGTGQKLPYVRIGREKQCAIEDVIFVAPTSTTSEMIKIEHSTDITRSRYQRPPYAMDSGHPIFFLFGDELAFLCPTRGFRHSDRLATGYLCAYYLETIQFTMNFLSDTTSKNRMMLGKFDLSVYSRLDNFGGLE